MDHYRPLWEKRFALHLSHCVDKQLTIQSNTAINVAVCINSFNRKLAAIALVLSFFASGPVRTAEPSEVVSPAKPAEYMIYQYPGVALLIRIDALEIEFEARVYDPERALISSSRVPSRRIGPVYRLIDAVDEARQLIIEVTPAQPSDRSRIRLQLVQLPMDERTSALQFEAFQLMSLAADSTTASDSTTWAMKTYTFQRAANAFEQLGWEELRLWSEYFVAHLVFYQLQDQNSAIELAQKVQTAARKAGFGVIEMAALQLEGAALLAVSPEGQGLPVQERFSETHRVLEAASELADSLGFQSERALALFSDGIAWERQEDFTRALARYRLALEIAVAAGDSEMANRIRNSAAFAYETQGSISGAIEMLDQIGDELSEQEAAVELAQSLYEKGRILNSSYRYREATGALSEALKLQETTGSGYLMTHTGFALGQAYYGVGQMDQAVKTLRESIARTPASGHQQELEKALRMLAAVHRFQGNFDAMSEARNEQAVFVSSDQQRARHMYERVLDLLAVTGAEIPAARSLLKQSYQLANASGKPLLAHQALLLLCTEGVGSARAPQECSRGKLRQSFDYLVSAGSPKYALAARFAWSKILRREGRLSQAIQNMSQVVDEIRYFRNVLPDVLGGWYWESRDRIFSEYMSMVLQQSMQGSVTTKDGRQALYALERLREIVSADSSGNPAVGHAGRAGDSESIRSMLAAREDVLDGAAALQRAPEINDVLHKSRQDFERSEPGLAADSLDRLIGQLHDETALLTYYFSSDVIHAVVAVRAGVHLFSLSHSEDIRSGLSELRRNLGNPFAMENDRLDILGRLMVKPVAHLLPELVYLMPSGPMSGIPFDLIRMDGQYLAEQHSIVNLMSLFALEKPPGRVDSGEIDLFFLAGNPDIKREVFNYEQEMSAEIRAVTDIFVGPALHIVQGSALQRDEFQDVRFEKADVIHLAIPGMISLEFPAQSKLMLSGTMENPGKEFLMPQDFQNKQFNASLAVLSSTRVQGSSGSNFSGYLGFVTDLLQSGVDVVVASLWLLDDPDLARFMDIFYRNLADNPNVPMALLKSRRQVLLSPETENAGLWAGFQVYIQ